MREAFTAALCTERHRFGCFNEAVELALITNNYVLSERRAALRLLLIFFHSRLPTAAHPEEAAQTALMPSLCKDFRANSSKARIMMCA